jgi:hypothetical protein
VNSRHATVLAAEALVLIAEPSQGFECDRNANGGVRISSLSIAGTFFSHIQRVSVLGVTVSGRTVGPSCPTARSGAPVALEQVPQRCWLSPGAPRPAMIGRRRSVG